MSDTAKLVIEIPKDRYADILRIADIQIVRRMPTLEQVVAHGIPLDDIKAEIEHMDELRYIGVPFISKYEVLSVIDKHIGKEESEDK